MKLIIILLFSSLQICALDPASIPIVPYSEEHGFMINNQAGTPKFSNISPEKQNNHKLMQERTNNNRYVPSFNPYHNSNLLGDYVFVQMPDGRIKITFKDCLPGYKAYFDMNMLHTSEAVPWIKRQYMSDSEHTKQYFANKFDNYRPTRVFHCVGNYHYPGFCEYVKSKAGFEDFLLNLGEQFKPNSALNQELAKSDNLQDFMVLRKMYQDKVRELEQKAQAEHQNNLRKILSARDFSEHGIKLLEHHNIADQFLYTGSLEQITQLKQITDFMNEVGEFRHAYHQIEELREISNSATGFGSLANNANRENLPDTSQVFLEIGQNLLALGRGLVAGCGRNVSGIYNMVRHPLNTGTEIAGLVKNIGIGIGNVTVMLAKNELGHLLNDQALIDSAQQDMDRYVDSARQIYQYAKKTWQDKSRIERYELVGNLAADLLLAKGLPVVGKLVPIKNLAQYKPQAFAKLGNIGREINQISGLTCAKGVKAVQQGFEVIKNYPQIIQGQQLLGEAVWHGNKCLNASNKYLRKVSNQYLKSILDPERLVMRLGKKIKKLPKNCLAKTKEWLNDEAIVVDTFGNRWSSKMGSDEWLINLSDKGKQSLTLLNEAVASGAETISTSRKIKHRIMTYSDQVKQIIRNNKYNLTSVIRNKYANSTFGEFYGPKVTEFLQGRASWMQHQINEFKGIDHLFMPSIKQNFNKGKLIEKIVGFHLDTGRKLEQTGMYVLKNCEEMIGGMYRGDLYCAGIFKKAKTFFPSSWDEAKLLNKISEACHNAHKISFMPRSKGIVEIRGMVEEGFEIVIRLNKRGKKLTAYPNPNPIKIL